MTKDGENGHRTCLGPWCDRPAAYPDGLCRDCHELLLARQTRNNTYTQALVNQKPRAMKSGDPVAK